jgi:response regulator RpfG family c-di-GMP phosphodiesterase
MGDRVLFIDDDENLLASFQRHFRGRFEVHTAPGGKEGLEVMESSGPFAVVVADLRMPGLDGIQVLTRVRERSPDTVRIMLTGNADLPAAVAAVNEGSIFRLLTKPCQAADLVGAIEAGLEQYRLKRAERELLEETLKGAVAVLTQILSLAYPRAFGRSARIRHLVVETGRKLGYPRPWELETATMLSQVGNLILPDYILAKLASGQRLESNEAQLYARHPKLAFDLLSTIPRLEGVAEIVAYQEKRFNGGGVPDDDRRGQDIPLGARILKVALDFDAQQAWEQSPVLSLEGLHRRSEWYDPEVVRAFEEVVRHQSGEEIVTVPIEDLTPHLVLAEDVRNSQGRVVAQRGVELTGPLVTQLKAFAAAGQAPDRVAVIKST